MLNEDSYQMRHIKKAISFSIAGTLGLGVIATLQGCSDQGPQPPSLSGFDNGNSAVEGNQFLVISQTGSNPDTFQVVEKHPTEGPTRAILRLPDGTERFMSEEELKRIAAEEAARIEAGTSRLTEDPAMHPGGLSLGETLVAAAAGALIGGMLANRLAGNANFQRNQQSYGGGRPTAAISQPARQQTANRTQPKSGFFGGSNRSSTGSVGSFGG
jgi:hypothetical protein